MASSKSLDDKHQKILRQLLLEPDNKKCFDCQNKGPVYVCLNFNTFVCTTCSGIHREFNHRVKSISMATFKPEEIKALQAGGNALARKQWLARWHPDDFPEPDSSDQARIRQFMKLKYHDKRWADNGRGDPRDRDHRDHRDAPAPGQGFRDLPRETSARDRSNSRGESFHAPPSRNDSVPQIKPLEQILGSNIPPIQFNNPQKSATQAPPPVQAPAASKQAELVAWDTPTKATSSAANDLNDLFSTPTPEQQAQYQQNQAQYQQQQQQAAYQQQQRNIMAQFGQTNPNAGAFFGPPAGQMHPNAGMFGPPPGAQQGGWGAPQQQQGMFNPNAFVPQQQQQQGGNFFQPQQQQPFGATPQQPFGGQPQQPFGGAPQQPFGAAPQQPFGGAPGGPFGGASPQAPFGTPNIQPPSPQPFGQGYPPTAPSPTFGGPAGQTLQPQGQKQPGFGTSPSGPGPNFGGLQPQQPQQPQQPAAPAKPDIFAALSPLNAGANFGGPKPADKRSSQNLGGGPAMSSSTGLHGPGMNGMNGSSTLHPNGSNTAANPFGGAPSPQTSQPLKPAGGQQDLFGGDLFGAAPTPTPQAQKPQQPQQQQDFFGGGSGGFGGAPSPQPQQPAHQQAQQDFFGGGSGGFGAPQKPQQPQQPAQQDFFGGGGFGAPQQQQHQPQQQQSQQDFFGGGSGGFGAPQQPQQQQKPPQHQSQQDFFGGGGGFGASPQQPSPNFQQQSQQQQQQANPFGQQPPSAFSPFGGQPQPQPQPQPQQQQANPFGAQSFQQQQQQPTAQAADPFNPFAF